MSEIILSPNQAQIFQTAGGDVVLRTQDGKVLGRCQRLAWTPEEIAELEKRLDSDCQRRSTTEVLKRLQSSEDK